MKPLEKIPTPAVNIKQIMGIVRQYETENPGRVIDAKAAADHLIAETEASEHWSNLDYHVMKRDCTDHSGTMEMVYLSIKRHDRDVIFKWRDLQAIKNQLVGPDCEAVQLFPGERRVVDTANQYHLWCIKNPGTYFPFGFTEGWQTDKIAGDWGGKQEKFNDPEG